MFSSQPESSDFDYPRGPLKRFHEEEEAAADGMNGSTMGFEEHRNKRLQTLPFRTSPTSQRKWDLSVGPEAGQQRPDPAMTPPGSFSESAPQAHLQHAAQQAALQQQQSIYGHHQGGIPAVVESGDMDMDMATDDNMLSPAVPLNYAQHQHHLAPGPSQPDQDSVVASRMPTPIQPSFAAQVRGNNWGGAAGNVMHNSMAVPPPAAERVAPTEDRSVPRTLEHPTMMGEWSMVQNRSLPSPISESGGEESGSPDMVMDSMAMQGQHSPSHEHIEGCGDHDHELLETPNHSAMRSSPAPMGAASSPIRGSGAALDSDPAATPSPRKGHTRSRHTIVAWTQQPGMKKSFSIGYRSDCEKCRNRVPGHFNHIIVS